MPSIDYASSSALLEDAFSEAEAHILAKTVPDAREEFRESSDVLFRSATQAYREVLLGCVVARIQDRSVNITQPYVDQGPNAFSGRSLDERVINPFLQNKRVPCSRGPYLSVFRRSVLLDSSIRSGLRDKAGYDALLALLAHVSSLTAATDLSLVLLYLLYKFAELREMAAIPLSRLHRVSLEQYDALITGLLSTPSGGRFPVLLVLASFTAVKDAFGLDWEITSQGINVADAASGAGGDITISRGEQILMAAEVTERRVDRSRLVATFTTKIAPAGISDYLFFITSAGVEPQAMQLARQYFTQGHEVNFLEIKTWILMSLATLGTVGRDAFNTTLLRLLELPDTPQSLKVGWNDQIARLTGSV